MHRILIAAIAAGGMFLQPRLMAQGGAYIDLTLPDLRADAASGIGCGWGRGVGDVPMPEVQLAVETDSLERTTYRVGEEILYQIRLTNVGKKPIAIPWNRDSHVMDPCDPSSPDWKLKGPKLNALFGLRFKDRMGVETDLALASFYGAMRDPETIRVLRPRESALILARDTVDGEQPHMGGELGKKLELPQAFDVYAFYHLNNSLLLNDYKTIESKTAIRVTIDRKAAH